METAQGSTGADGKPNATVTNSEDVKTVASSTAPVATVSDEVEDVPDPDEDDLDDLDGMPVHPPVRRF
jgi:hypothetical protein